MANRYDNGSVAKFNPLSFNELAAVPTMIRKKHDASIAAAEAMRIKTNPYSKHYTRALELKQQMDNEIAKNVDILNKEGYNPTTFQNIIKLNRQHQDMISPTGEIGQINAENINIKKINEEYDKLGKEKNWGQETVDYWKNKALKEYNEKPLYDSNGRILSYSGPEGVANKVDYNKRLHELASSAKMSVSEFSNAVTKLGMDEKSGYNVANKNSEAHKLGDNYAGVKAAYDTLKREMYDPTSEVYKSMRYEGRDPNSLLDILKTQSNIYNQNVKSDEYSKDINPFGSGPGSGNGGNPLAIPSTIYDPSTQKTLTSEVKNTDYSKIGTNKSTTGGVPGQFTQNTQKVKIGYKDLLTDPIAQKLYEKSYDKLVADKKIPKGADKNSNEVAKIVGFYMKNYVNVPSIANDIILPDTATNSQQFMGEFDRQTGPNRDATANSNLNNGYRTIIDPVSRKELSPEEFRDKGYSVKYIGYDDVLSYNNYKFKGNNNKNQSVLTHKIEVLDNKGKSLGQTAMTRTKQEMETPEFKKAYQISHVYRHAINNLDDWVIPSATNNFKVKIKSNGLFDIEYNGNLYEDATGRDYKFMINKAISEKQ